MHCGVSIAVSLRVNVFLLSVRIAKPLRHMVLRKTSHSLFNIFMILYRRPNLNRRDNGPLAADLMQVHQYVDHARSCQWRRDR